MCRRSQAVAYFRDFAFSHQVHLSDSPKAQHPLWPASAPTPIYVQGWNGVGLANDPFIQTKRLESGRTHSDPE